jgi:hypothetical protein
LVPTSDHHAERNMNKSFLPTADQHVGFSRHAGVNRVLR